jgi:hypothetical protein
MSPRKNLVRVVALLGASYLLLSQTGCPKPTPGPGFVSVYELDYIMWLQRIEIKPANGADPETAFKEALSVSPLYETTFKPTPEPSSCISIDHRETRRIAGAVTTESKAESGSLACQIIPPPDAIHVSQWVLFKSAGEKEDFKKKLGL